MRATESKLSSTRLDNRQPISISRALQVNRQTYIIKLTTKPSPDNYWE